jgi:hypothetical protein
MTIGELKKIIIDNNLQDDAEIFVQIVDASVLSNHGFIIVLWDGTITLIMRCIHLRMGILIFQKKI